MERPFADWGAARPAGMGDWAGGKVEIGKGLSWGAGSGRSRHLPSSLCRGAGYRGACFHFCTWGFQLDREEGFTPHGPIHYHRQRLVEYLSSPAWGPRAGGSILRGPFLFLQGPSLSFIEFISVTPELTFLPGQRDGTRPQVPVALAHCPRNRMLPVYVYGLVG